MSSADVLARPQAPAWRAWLELARISNSPTVVSNAIAGAALATAAAPARSVALAAAALALFYTAGMILNDVLDEDVDRRERPERPLPSGRVSRPAALAAVAGLFVLGSALLALVGIAPLLAGTGLIGLIVLYDAWHKGNALSPVLMAGCRVLAYVVAGLAVADTLDSRFWGAAAMLFLYVIGLTQLAKAEGGGLAARWPVLALLAPAAYWATELTSPAAALLLAAFVAWTAWAVRLALVERRIGAAVGRLIAGIALYDALVVAGVGGEAVAVAVCLAALAATVGLQTRIAGT